ncbi:hypothetical protein [Ktedonospora formicarum]|uniref:Uncharacterized protein n=1 Tax=Ktedonospora formicarum TaxID=2778364 RepID=A0A8J3IE00_9CHLR|nr:hypothetical protein [Ktedonospora formicarum]GHO49569.1 hypothetical protein KSX_77320 [Ktedonospora formicarum]
MLQGKRWSIGGLILLLLCVGCLAGFMKPLSGAARVVEGATQVIQFHPDANVNQSASGNCWVNSLATARVDAWRCALGNEIYDPCFDKVDARPTGDVVVCDANPATGRKGIQVHLTQPLPQAIPEKGQATRAWLLLLSNGAYCAFLTGATGEVGGMRINYGCSDSSTVVGMPTMGKLWMVHNLPQGSQSPVEVPVKTAWL